MKKNILIIILVIVLVLVGCRTVSAEYKRFDVYMERLDDDRNVYIGMFKDTETGTTCYFMAGNIVLTMDCLDEK